MECLYLALLTPFSIKFSKWIQTLDLKVLNDMRVSWEWSGNGVGSLGVLKETILFWDREACSYTCDCENANGSF